MKKVTLMALCLISLLSLITCPQPETTTGSLCIKVREDFFRTVEPDVEMVIDSYTISGTGPGGASFLQEGVMTNSLSQSGLLIGTWVIRVDGLNSDGKIIASDQKSVMVYVMQTTDVIMTVVPVSGYGTLALSLSWPVSSFISAPAVMAGLTPVNGAREELTFAIEDTKATYTGSWAAGYYYLNLKLLDGNMYIAGRTEAVRILAGEISAADYSYQGTGTLNIMVESDLQNPIAIAFSGNRSNIRQGTDMSITTDCSETPDTYQWFLNGDLLEGETGSGITIGSNLAIGSYILNLVVSKGTRLGSGELHFTVNSLSEKIIIKALAYGDNTSYEGVNWMRIVNAFEGENPGIDIQYELLSGTAYHDRVAARLNEGDIPDIACMGGDAIWGAPWKRAGQQFDHRPLLDPAYFDLNLITPMGPNGEIYEIPMGTANITSVLYMNQPLVQSLGFTAPVDYEDLVAMVPAARAAGLEVISIDGADGWAWNSCLMSCIIGRFSSDPHWVSGAVEGTHRFNDQVFIDSLAMITRMRNDGILSDQVLTCDYSTNISNFNDGKALFMIQGQWAISDIHYPLADNTLLLAFPVQLYEQEATAGTMSGAITPGYGLTRAGAADPVVRAAAMQFFMYLHSPAETMQRLRNGAIVAPVLKNFEIPADLPEIVKRKIALGLADNTTDVIDTFLTGAPNDALNTGMLNIAAGTATPAQVADQVENLLRP